MSEPTYALKRECEACDQPVPDDFVPNDYGLYGYCPSCVAEIGDDEEASDRE
jgi:hypothetical protein